MEFLLVQNWDPILMMDVLGVVTCGTLVLLLWSRTEPRAAETHRRSIAGEFLGEVAARLIRQETRRAVESLQKSLLAQAGSVGGNQPWRRTHTPGGGKVRAESNAQARTPLRPSGRSIYRRARQMAELGIRPMEIARRVALPLCEIELISKIVRLGHLADAYPRHAMAA